MIRLVIFYVWINELFGIKTLKVQDSSHFTCWGVSSLFTRDLPVSMQTSGIIDGQWMQSWFVLSTENRTFSKSLYLEEHEEKRILTSAPEDYFPDEKDLRIPWSIWELPQWRYLGVRNTIYNSYFHVYILLQALVTQNTYIYAHGIIGTKVWRTSGILRYVSWP